MYKIKRFSSELSEFDKEYVYGLRKDAKSSKRKSKIISSVGGGILGGTLSSRIVPKKYKAVGALAGAVAGVYGGNKLGSKIGDKLVERSENKIDKYKSMDDESKFNVRRKYNDKRMRRIANDSASAFLTYNNLH